MTDKKVTRPSLDSFFKTDFRQWTEEEVMKAVDYTKKNYPHIWQELIEEELEEETDDIYAESDVTGMLLSILSKLYPECDSPDITRLSRRFHVVLCSEIDKDYSNGE